MPNSSARKPAKGTESALLRKWGKPRLLRPDDLPPGLGEMREPPERAYLWGALPPTPWVSIVGTRTPSESGSRAAFTLAKRLASRGVTIASGGAVGIDTAAHLGALAARGKTVVVAPTWLPTAYPKRNHRLFDRVLRSGGAYLTVSPERAKPLAFVFFRRNETLMALSHATVLGEARHQSGAKNAMSHARFLGRPRFALPFSFGDPRADGPWSEIVREGAEVLNDEQPILRLLEEYGTFPNPAWWDYLCEARGGGVVSEEEAVDTSPRGLVASAIVDGARTPDAVSGSTGLGLAEVQHELLLMTLDGVVQEDERGLLRYHSPPHGRP